MEPKESVEELNDRLAQEHSIDEYYDSSFFAIRWIESKRLRIIREMIQSTPGCRILEIGSGGGHVLRQFRDAKLTAVDVSDVFLETARKNLEGYDAQFLKGEVETLGLAAHSFDRIICTEVLEHTEDPERILEEIARLLKSDGRTVITVPNDPLINGVKSMVRATPLGWALRNRINWGGDAYHLHQWRPAEFRILLEKHFSVEEQRSAPFDRFPIRACFLCRPRS